jgi:hypothetical protein
VTKDCKHGDTAVLVLDLTEAVEALLISILKNLKRIPESKRSLSTKGILEAHLERSRLGSGAGRGKGRNGYKGSKDGDELHDDE